MVVTMICGILWVLLNHTHTKGLSVASMWDFLDWSDKKNRGFVKGHNEISPMFLSNLGYI